MTQRPAETPLSTPTQPVPFDRIAAEHVVPSVRALIEASNRALDAIGAATDVPTYDNTLLALERATEKLEYAMGVIEHLESVATTPEFRAAYNTILPEVSALWSGVPLRPALWQRLLAFSETAEA